MDGSLRERPRAWAARGPGSRLQVAVGRGYQDQRDVHQEARIGSVQGSLPQALCRRRQHPRATPDCHGADCHPTAAETWQMGLKRPGEWRCNGRLRSRIKVSPARRRRLRRPSRVHRPSSGAQRPVSTSRPRDRELQRRPSAVAHPPCHAVATRACRCDLAPPAVTAPSPRRRDSSSTPRMSLARHTSAAATARLGSRPD